jgi:ATP-dependent Lhr-like helicase
MNRRVVIAAFTLSAVGLALGSAAVAQAQRGRLVERQHPGRRKTGRQVSFSTDLIYDVLRKYEPEHLLLRAAWDDARARMTELGRLVRLVDRAAATMVHVEADRITPMAVPLMVIVGREALPPGAEADETLLMQAEALAEAAMHLG